MGRWQVRDWENNFIFHITHSVLLEIFKNTFWNHQGNLFNRFTNNDVENININMPLTKETQFHVICVCMCIWMHRKCVVNTHTIILTVNICNVMSSLYVFLHILQFLWALLMFRIKNMLHKRPQLCFTHTHNYVVTHTLTHIYIHARLLNLCVQKGYYHENSRLHCSEIKNELEKPN